MAHQTFDSATKTRALRRTVAAAIITGLTTSAIAQECFEFDRVPSPNFGTDANFLIGAAALSAGDAWAVGHYRAGSTQLPLSIHWDGVATELLPMPTPPSSISGPNVMLYDVHAFASDDVWAVGSNPPASTGSAATETLVYHWNGSAWSIVPSAIGCCGSFGSQFYSIDGVSGDDFWAVGYKANEVAANPFAAHWNGSEWEEYNLPPSTGTRNALKDLHVIASDDIWALEGVGNGPPVAPRRIFHWDGSSWDIGAPAINSVLYFAAEAIFAFGPSDIWVSSVRASGGQIVMLHWNGSAWEQMNVPVFAYEFFGNAPDDFYAVGNTSVMHWNGAQWSVVATIPGVPEGNIFDAELAADGTLWCAGNTQPGPASRTLTATLVTCGPDCPPDFDGDGFVTGADFDAFVAAFESGAGTADFDGDGFITGVDFDAFVFAFEAGC